MFRHGAAAEVVEIEQDPIDPGTHDDLIPLSVLRLDLDPGEPWALFLGRRGIAFRPDRIGRDAVTAGDAQRLIAERREQELRKQRHLKVAEEEAIEADRAWRAALPQGIPWHEMPGDPGGSPAAVMLQQAQDAERTTPSAGEWMFKPAGEITGGTFNGEDWS
jgi:hypothetical protein